MPPEQLPATTKAVVEALSSVEDAVTRLAEAWEAWLRTEQEGNARLDAMRQELATLNAALANRATGHRVHLGMGESGRVKPEVTAVGETMAQAKDLAKSTMDELIAHYKHTVPQRGKAATS